MNNVFESVAISGRQGQRNLLVKIAKEIKAEHGSRIHLFCQLPDEVEIYEDLMDDGLFETIDFAPRLMPMELPNGFDEKEVMERARELEARYDVTINSLVVRSRHFGRGFAPGGYFHPRSRISEHATYEQMVVVYNEALTFWEDAFRDKGITLLINATPESYVIAREMGIPCRTLIDARYKNFWHWSVDDLETVPEVEEHYAKIDEAPPTDELDAPPTLYMKFRSDALGQATLRGFFGLLYSQSKRHLIWRLTGYYKAKEYYYSSEIRHIYHVWRDLNRLYKWNLATVEDLKGKDFVFYPLHIEPERTLQGASPEYFYQHTSIISIARDLPAGVMLAVKEHIPAAGRRPSNFYDQIRDLKNVILVDPREHGLEIVRHALATITIAGSAGLEAAIFGKPVITFGRHTLYNFLPHVLNAHSEESIRGHLSDAIYGKIDLEKAKRDGARFFQALKDSSFDLRDFDVRDPSGIESDLPRVAYERLVRSLG
jgi:hypothetical protein